MRKIHSSRATRVAMKLRALLGGRMYLLPLLLLLTGYRLVWVHWQYPPPSTPQVPPPFTPPCQPHPTTCTGLCAQVSSFVKQQREGVLKNPESWLWYYQGILDYYKCAKAKIVVEVGVAWGAQTAFHLKHTHDFFDEYHVVDPFLAGYDPTDPMSSLFLEAAPNATAKDISNAWYQSIAKELGHDGHYLGDEPMEPGGCTLRMHHKPSVEAAKLFGDASVDAAISSLTPL